MCVCPVCGLPRLPGKDVSWTNGDVGAEGVNAVSMEPWRPIPSDGPEPCSWRVFFVWRPCDMKVPCFFFSSRTQAMQRLVSSQAGNGTDLVRTIINGTSNVASLSIIQRKIIGGKLGEGVLWIFPLQMSAVKGARGRFVHLGRKNPLSHEPSAQTSTIQELFITSGRQGVDEPPLQGRHPRLHSPL